MRNVEKSPNIVHERVETSAKEIVKINNCSLHDKIFWKFKASVGIGRFKNLKVLNLLGI